MGIKLKCIVHTVIANAIKMYNTQGPVFCNGEKGQLYIGGYHIHPVCYLLYKPDCVFLPASNWKLVDDFPYLRT